MEDIDSENLNKSKLWFYTHLSFLDKVILDQCTNLKSKISDIEEKL